MDDTVLIYADGASRGNPGPSAYGFLISDQRGKILATESGALGKATNNEAEYHAVINSLQKAASLSARRVVVHSDSELVIRQLRGDYQVRKPHLGDLFFQVRKLQGNFSSVEYVHLPRENPMIRIVDKLCNETLDSKKS